MTFFELLNCINLLFWLYARFLKFRFFKFASLQLKTKLSNNHNLSQLLMSNCFFLFCHDYRKKVSDAYPCKSNADVTSMLGKMWQELPIEEKEYYKKLSYTVPRQITKKKKTKKHEQYQFSFKLKLVQSKASINKAPTQQKCVLPSMRYNENNTYVQPIRLPGIESLLALQPIIFYQ